MSDTNQTACVRALAAAIMANVPTLVWGNPGEGKALDNETPIPGPDGWKKMGDLRIGDRVFDQNGDPCNVTGVYPQPDGRECFELVFDDGSTIVADADHQWITETRRDRMAKRLAEIGVVVSYQQWTPSGPVTTSDISSTVRVDDGQRVNHSIPLAGPLSYPAVDLPVAPYTLGAWLGDGSSDGSQITTMDVEVLAAIASDGYSTKRYKGDRSGQAATYGISSGASSHSGSMPALLRQAGVLNNKHIPASYLMASVDQRMNLLRGLMDTDGTVDHVGSPNVSFTSIRKVLADDVLTLALGLGFKATWTERPVPTGRNGRGEVVVYTVKFTTCRDVFTVERKRTVHGLSTQRSTTQRRYITEVRPVESRPVTCITVDSDDHLFLAGEQCIVTHNTAIVEAMGRNDGRHVETVVGSNREAADFLGLPIDDKDEQGNPITSYAALGWATRLRTADRGLLFLDELTTAAPSVMKAMLRVMQEREVGEVRLPDSVSIVAAANPPEIAVDGWDLSAPIANRLMHLDWAYSFDAWMDGFVTDFADAPNVDVDSVTTDGSHEQQARVRGLIASFLNNRPDLLQKCPTDPALAGKGWPSRRSWTNAAKVLSFVPEDDADVAHMVLVGCVGEAAATEYLAWQATAALADPADAMADPKSVDWKSARPDQAFALVQSVLALAMMRDSDADFDAAYAVFGECAKQGKPDVATPGVMRLVRRTKRFPKSIEPHFGKLFDHLAGSVAPSS